MLRRRRIRDRSPAKHKLFTRVRCCLSNQEMMFRRGEKKKGEKSQRATPYINLHTNSFHTIIQQNVPENMYMYVYIIYYIYIKSPQQ